MNQLNPLNDFVRVVNLKRINSSTGAEEPITTGSPTGFLATSKEPDATTAHASLSANGVYIGATAGYEAGDWMFQLDAAVLTKALLETYFLTGVPYFIVNLASDVRVYEQLDYAASRAAIVS